MTQLIYKSVDELQEAIDSYFQSKRKETDNGIVFRPTLTGLAIALGIDRKTLYNYSKRDDYFPTIKRARDIVEEALEENLYGNSVTGTIFNLKNNFGWVDKYENDNNDKLTVTIAGPDVKTI